MTASEVPEQLTSADDAILEELQEHKLDYLALIANRRGLHLKFVEKRCEILERQGYIEKASNEVTYRLTEKGEHYLETTVRV